MNNQISPRSSATQSGAEARYPSVEFSKFNSWEAIQSNPQNHVGLGMLTSRLAQPSEAEKEINGRVINTLKAGVKSHGVVFRGSAQKIYERFAEKGEVSSYASDFEAVRNQYVDQVCLKFRQRLEEIKGMLKGLYFLNEEVDKLLDRPRISKLLEKQVLTNAEFEELNGAMIAFELFLKNMMRDLSGSDVPKEQAEIIKQGRLRIIVNGRLEMVDKMKKALNDLGMSGDLVVDGVLGVKALSVLNKTKLSDEDYKVLEEACPRLAAAYEYIVSVKELVSSFKLSADQQLKSISLHDFTDSLFGMLTADIKAGEVISWEKSRIAKELAGKGYPAESFSPAFKKKFSVWLQGNRPCVEEFVNVLKSEVDWIAFMRCAWKVEGVEAEIAQYDDLETSLFIPQREISLAYYTGSKEALKKSKEEIAAFLAHYFGEDKELPAHVFSIDMLERFWAAKKKRPGLEDSQKPFNEGDRVELKAQCKAINRRHNHYVNLIKRPFVGYVNISELGATEMLEKLSEAGYGSFIDYHGESGQFVRFFMPEGCYEYNIKKGTALSPEGVLVENKAELQRLFDFYYFAAFFLSKDKQAQTTPETDASIPVPPPLPNFSKSPSVKEDESIIPDTKSISRESSGFSIDALLKDLASSGTNILRKTKKDANGVATQSKLDKLRTLKPEQNIRDSFMGSLQSAVANPQLRNVSPPKTSEERMKELKQEEVRKADELSQANSATINQMLASAARQRRAQMAIDE